LAPILLSNIFGDFYTKFTNPLEKLLAEKLPQLP
jgi:hypothetical protein